MRQKRLWSGVLFQLARESYLKQRVTVKRMENLWQAGDGAGMLRLGRKKGTCVYVGGAKKQKQKRKPESRPKDIYLHTHTHMWKIYTNLYIRLIVDS